MVYSSHDEDMPTLEEMFFLNDEGKASTSGIKSEECKVVLWSGTYVPERQAPKDFDKGKDKAQNKGKEVESLGKNPEKTRSTDEEYNVLAHLRKIPALLSIFDALMMSQDLREVLIQALQNPEKYKSYFIEQNMQEALFTAKRAACINFTDDDLLIGTADHNRPLYITGDCSGQKIGRILVDAGSSINIMPLKTLKTITLDVKNLSDEKVIIHGFNQNSQKAMRAITLNLQCGSLKVPTKFYVIDAETSYRALLGRLWLHSNQVIPSTMHQCLKYIENGKQKRIDRDVKPFGVHEIKFNDAQYFLPKPATTPSRPITKADQKSFNKGPKFDTSSGEEEEVKFNLKPRGARIQKPGRKSGEEVTFHFKHVATSKVRTKPSEINSSDSEEEVIFNFKPANSPRIQIIEVTSGENFEESDDSGNITSEEVIDRSRQLWDEESNEEIIYHILKKPYKGPETDNESEESFMINVGSNSERDNPARSRLANEECLWRKNFEAHIWNAINEMRHQIENNMRDLRVLFPHPIANNLKAVRSARKRVAQYLLLFSICFDPN
jgi:hypothetical protein